jgi:hypothetical protein
MTISRRSFLGSVAFAASPAFLKGETRPEPPFSNAATKKERSPLNADRFDPWVEVIPKHLTEAVKEVRRLSGDRPILAVVKNNGYGLGLGMCKKIMNAHKGDILITNNKDRGMTVQLTLPLVPAKNKKICK